MGKKKPPPPPPDPPEPLEVVWSSRFRRDVEKARRAGRDMAKLAAVMTAIAERRRLEPAREDHALKGDWKGYRDCHVEGDWLLIYSTRPMAVVRTSPAPGRIPRSSADRRKGRADPMRTIEAFREAEDADPWRRYIVRTSDGEEVLVDRPGHVRWEEPDPEYVRVAAGDGEFMLIALDAVVMLYFPRDGRPR